jgi:hypothetical protein
MADDTYQHVLCSVINSVAERVGYGGPVPVNYVLSYTPLNDLTIETAKEVVLEACETKPFLTLHRRQNAPDEIQLDRSSYDALVDFSNDCSEDVQRSIIDNPA